VLMNKGSLK